MGAFLWSSTFILLGYFLGDRWQAVSARIHHSLVLVACVLGGLAAVYLVWRRMPNKPH
jgi:membrane protein DedA with SNARE-associated domain